MKSQLDEILNTQNCFDRIDDLFTKQLIIFGASSGGYKLKRYLNSIGIDIEYFCDNNPNKWGKLLESKEIISPQQLKEYSKKNDYLVCIASQWARDISLQLNNMSFDYIDLTYFDDRWKDKYEKSIVYNNSDKIYKAYELFEDELSRETFVAMLQYRFTLDPMKFKISDYEQYFHPKTQIKGGDVLIDAGAYDGRTSIKFSNKINNELVIFAFEPEASNFDLLKKNIKNAKLKNVKMIQAGLWSCNREAFININANTGSQIFVMPKMNKPCNVVELKSIDSFLDSEKVIPNVIKMDIEGAEKEAMTGAQGTITKYKPTLIICVYHEPDDLWEIPLYINSLNCGYKFYLGHHSQSLSETVLYCL